jgi:DNA invertase Pin-like site-specific DNA recombinase
VYDNGVEAITSGGTVVTTGTRVVGYTRVSTAEQVESGGGLEAQRLAIAAECERRGWELAAIHEDAGASGKSMRGRPALAAALAAVESGEAAGIVVSKLDRLSRSLLDFAGIIARANKAGWNLVALDLGVDLSTPNGKFIANVMASAAEWERELISQRTRDGIAAKVAAGTLRGKLGRPSQIDAATERRILQLRRGGDSMQQIADRLNADGVQTARPGSTWHASTVKRVLDRRARVTR